MLLVITYVVYIYIYEDLLAINLSRSSGLDEEQIAEIYKKYGDHLYDKADFDGAMSAFIKTIGIVQPSYVIRKVGMRIVQAKWALIRSAYSF